MNVCTRLCDKLCFVCTKNHNLSTWRWHERKSGQNKNRCQWSLYCISFWFVRFALSDFSEWQIGFASVSLPSSQIDNKTALIFFSKTLRTFRSAVLLLASVPGVLLCVASHLYWLLIICSCRKKKKRRKKSMACLKHPIWMSLIPSPLKKNQMCPEGRKQSSFCFLHSIWTLEVSSCDWWSCNLCSCAVMVSSSAPKSMNRIAFKVPSLLWKGQPKIGRCFYWPLLHGYLTEMMDFQPLQTGKFKKTSLEMTSVLIHSVNTQSTAEKSELTKRK